MSKTHCESCGASPSDYGDHHSIGCGRFQESNVVALYDCYVHVCDCGSSDFKLLDDNRIMCSRCETIILWTVNK